MKLHLVTVGASPRGALAEASADYLARLRHYMKVEESALPAAKRREDPREAEQAEAGAILKAAASADWVMLLDERGRALTSVELASRLQEWQNRSMKSVAWVIGGATGVNDAVRRRASATLQLSAFTLAHDLARLVLLEQLYRACTILRGEPYHK